MTQAAVSQLVVCAKWFAALPLSAHLPLLMLSLIVFPHNKTIRCWSVVHAAFLISEKGG